MTAKQKTLSGHRCERAIMDAKCEIFMNWIKKLHMHLQKTQI